MNILDEIVANKRTEVQQQQLHVSLEQLLCMEQMERSTLSMREALRTSPTGIISEFKRKSPSKGWINRDAAPEEVVLGYAEQGAAAISILTDRLFFGGDIADLIKVRAAVNTPILRKEFIVDRYQIYQSKVIGADAILLIASVLDRDTCAEFIELAHELGLEVLLELHGEEELPYATLPADMIGINNRNLTTFVTDATHSLRMMEQLPKGGLYVSESGLSEATMVATLRRAGFSGFLMGENFMKTATPPQALGQFITQLTSLQP